MKRGIIITGISIIVLLSIYYFLLDGQKKTTKENESNFKPEVTDQSLGEIMDELGIKGS